MTNKKTSKKIIMPIKVSKLKANASHNMTIKKASKLAKSGRQDVLDEIKLLLVKHDLDMESILLKYKELLDSPHEMPKASDIVKVLENLQKLHQVDTPQGEQVKNLIIMFQDKSNKEIVNYLGELTNKTKEYLDELGHSESMPIKVG